ncbi:hypothetical protein AGABI2DRAFT_139575 [Agaricus bisporus var. bisporus H97]|uniref:hypothetical protein n=1 Tax=Agaricus bisporus var. bisporus (strain H97 / ATCC MYA-4626 / FGSC 10389) TaxID=936046 RepID=UPI00029F54DC|nr:hypothetical protein AGABI2DRAFT_139575 [Agaricus bisporus var. bisporus H97]EKV42166.1 hypothetical protein AGABI2DRAFT_139575 [Agaricus bisporus var. bisporus H97]
MALGGDFPSNFEQYWCHVDSTDVVAISSPLHLFQISRRLNITSASTSATLPT